MNIVFAKAKKIIVTLGKPKKNIKIMKWNISVIIKKYNSDLASSGEQMLKRLLYSQIYNYKYNN